MEKQEIQPSKKKPFILVKRDKEVLITVGNYQIVKETFKSFKDAEKYLEEQNYDVVFNLFSLFKLLDNENKKTEKQVQ